MNKGLTLTALVALAATACGGGGSSSAPVPLPVVADEVVVFGPISSFGSVTVNGVTFDTTSVTVMMDDEPGNVSDLRFGMLVSVGGTIDPDTALAQANEIRFVDDVEGPIMSMNRVINSFVVLGRTVFVDELTVFDNATFEDLEVGHVVEVSGLWRHEQQLQATFVHRTAMQFEAGMTMQVKGEISDLDIGQQHFRIGAQWCNYSAAMMELDGADLANGMYVQVTSMAMIENNQMIADAVQARDRDRDRYRLCAGECLYELIGYVTAYETATNFEVDGQAVTVTHATVYVNGTVDSIALDAKVSVDGTLDETGVLLADRIFFHVPSLVEIKGDINGLDRDAEIVSVFDIAVQTNQFTLFRDHTSSGPPTFGFGDLIDGDRVEIRAVLDGSLVIATRLERDDPDDTVTLKAPVDSVNVYAKSVEMLGVTVASDENTVFQNAAHVEIDAEEFFALVDTESIVRAEGNYDASSATITANKMFLRVCLNSCF
jgi:hypothetical protein